MLKSLRNRNRAAKTKAVAIESDSVVLDPKAACERVGVTYPKHLDRVFHHQDASGTRVQGGDARHWEFIDGESVDIVDKPVKPMKSSYANKNFKDMTREIGPSWM